MTTTAKLCTALRLRPSWKFFTENGANARQPIPNRPVLDRLNDEWLRNCVDNPVQRSTNRTDGPTQYHLYGQLSFTPQSLLALQQIIEYLPVIRALGVWYDEETIVGRYESTLKPFYSELDTVLASNQRDPQKAFQQLVLHWERRFLTAGIPPHQYLGMLLSNQPLMSDLYALDTLQFQRNGMIYPLLAYLPDSKPASQTRSISEKLGTIIDRSLTIILERKLLACGLDFKPVDRSCLHQRQMLRSINAQLTSLSAEFKKSNDGKQLRQLLGRLEASSMVLGVDEARQMDALLKTWQRWKYLQTISNPVNSVRLKELRAATISSGSYAALIILPRSHLFAMERRLK